MGGVGDERELYMFVGGCRMFEVYVEMVFDVIGIFIFGIIGISEFGEDGFIGFVNDVG